MDEDRVRHVRCQAQSNLPVCGDQSDPMDDTGISTTSRFVIQDAAVEALGTD